LGWWVALALLAGCQSVEGPDLGEIYSRAAMFHGADRRPVIVVPGILGSRLEEPEGGLVAWGAFGRGAVDPRTDEGARCVSLPMAVGQPLSELRDQVRATTVLDRVEISLLGVPISLRAYAQVLGTLGVGGYRDQLLAQAGAVDYGGGHFTCFQFPYDWRRDCAESAAELYRFVKQQQAYVRAELIKRDHDDPGDKPVDIVAHSMGSLVTRYFLMYGSAPLPEDGSLPEVTWAGASLVNRVIFVGPPNAGSVYSLEQLVAGLDLWPWAPSYEPAILGTLPAVYQLLPRSRHKLVVDRARGEDQALDVYDPGVWERYGWGLVDPEQDRVLKQLLPGLPSRESRRRVALDHLAKCLKRAEQFHRAVDRRVERLPAPALHLILGDSMPTGRVIAVDGRGRLKVTQHAPGDGTVTRASALLDEREGHTWQPQLASPLHHDSVTFLFRDHLGLTKDPAFADNVLYLLLETQATR
jgi:pimeloyl-ACP methyl ester carboxylesterase